MIPTRPAGSVTPDSQWVQSAIIQAGDAVGTANRVEGVTLSVDKTLPYRRLYVAGFIIPNFRTAYATGTSDARFVMRMANEQTEFAKFEWQNPNTVGSAWPTTSGNLRDFGVGRPQFRVSMRQQIQPFMFGWVDPPMSDGIELSFRTQDAAPTPTAQEWLVSCAPFRMKAAINSITINAERSTEVTPGQLFFFVGCLSSDSPI